MPAESSNLAPLLQPPVYITLLDDPALVDGLPAAGETEDDLDELPRLHLKRNDRHAFLFGRTL